MKKKIEDAIVILFAIFLICYAVYALVYILKWSPGKVGYLEVILSINFSPMIIIHAFSSFTVTTAFWAAFAMIIFALRKKFNLHLKSLEDFVNRFYLPVLISIFMGLWLDEKQFNMFISVTSLFALLSPLTGSFYSRNQVNQMNEKSGKSELSCSESESEK